MTDTCDNFRPSPSETRGVNLCGTTEGVRMGLCGWNFVRSALPRSPVIPHSVLINCYGIFPCCTPQCTYNVLLWYSGKRVGLRFRFYRCQAPPVFSARSKTLSTPKIAKLYHLGMSVTICILLRILKTIQKRSKMLRSFSTRFV